MHFLFCDESNLQEVNGDFLIYGGLVVDADVLHKLSLGIDAIRQKYSVPTDFELKFNPKPEGCTNQQFIELKREIIGLASEMNVGFIAYVILHDIAVNADAARRNGINTVCLYFNEIIGRKKDHGMVLIDRFNDAGNEIESHLRAKFAVGVTMPDGNRRLSNIVGFHYSAIGQGHMPSVVDIVVGSLRLAINAHTRQQEHLFKVAAACCKMIAPLFIREKQGAPIHDLGFCFSPKKVGHYPYRLKYQNLKSYLADNGIDTSQIISD